MSRGRSQGAATCHVMSGDPISPINGCNMLQLANGAPPRSLIAAPIAAIAPTRSRAKAAETGFTSYFHTCYMPHWLLFSEGRSAHCSRWRFSSWVSSRSRSASLSSFATSPRTILINDSKAASWLVCSPTFLSSHLCEFSTW